MVRKLKRARIEEIIVEDDRQISTFLRLGAEEERQAQDQRKRLGRWLRKHRKAT
jgi:hypothetical protein